MEPLRADKLNASAVCSATGGMGLLRPLVDSGLVPRSLPVSATSLTGYSGGGKKMIAEY